jgi:quercetin dioxygenase-like cupin family protein
LIALDGRAAAQAAVSARPGRPATTVVYDSDDLRLIVFRIGPGEAVAPHKSASTVQLSILEGRGLVSGERNRIVQEHSCTAGDVVVFAPNELHGMRAIDDTLLILATIAPRPGTR